MNEVVIAAEDLRPLEHDEAMGLAETELERLLALVDDLTEADWSRPTDCTGWDVKAVLAHLLGMLELQADRQELARQVGTAAEIAERTGGLRLDALTALQVEEHAHLTTGELTRALHEAAPRGLAARRALTEQQRATPYSPELPGEGMWTLGYLYDVIHTRDPWLHRVDICRATGRELVLTPEHDGRIVSDVVADWAPRHGQPFTLVLSGPAGGTFVAEPTRRRPDRTSSTMRDDGARIELDAVEFCRILSGRRHGTGLLATRVTF